MSGLEFEGVRTVRLRVCHGSPYYAHKVPLN